ncbi:MAG: hypothetical protein HY848_06840 [Betaproteobacteria bacterium]|nr:hypothetical protein [Betaproteobacteria bacterium]
MFIDKESERALIIVAELLGVISAICLLIPALRDGRLKLLIEKLGPRIKNPALEKLRSEWVARMRESLTRWDPLDFRLLVAGIILAGFCSLIKLVVAIYGN